MRRTVALLLLAAAAVAACGKGEPHGSAQVKPLAKLLPLPRPDDTFSVTATSSIDGRTVTRSGSSVVTWRWAADAPDGTEVLRTEGLRTELWWRSDTGLAVWSGEGWTTIEGEAPAGLPTSRDQGQLRAAVSVEEPLGSGDRVDGCLRLRIAEAQEGSAADGAFTRVEERTLCPARGETVIERTARGPMGERVERLIRR